MILHGLSYRAQSSFTDWLYSDWSEDKYIAYSMLNAIPGVSNYMDYLLDQRQDMEYMKRNQLDWSDIHDPRKLHQTSSSSRLYGSGISFVSRNVTRLYR